MKKGGTLEAILFVGSCILVLITAGLFFTKEDTRHDKAKEEQTFRESMVNLEYAIRQTNGFMDDLSRRVKIVEERKELDVTIKYPVQVTILRPKQKLPPLPVQIHHPAPTLQPHENN